MKVKRFLDSMMMSSSIKAVIIRVNGREKDTINLHMLESANYGEYGEDKIMTFQVMGEHLILNLKDR